jgi:hypothetical protein
LVALAPVTAPAHGPALTIHHHGGHRNFALASDQFGVSQQPPHPEELLRRLQIIRPCSVHNASA